MFFFFVVFREDVLNCLIKIKVDANYKNLVKKRAVDYLTSHKEENNSIKMLRMAMHNRGRTSEESVYSSKFPSQRLFSPKYLHFVFCV